MVSIITKNRLLSNFTWLKFLVLGTLGSELTKRICKMNREVIRLCDTVKHFIFARLRFREFGDFRNGVLET